MKDKQKKYLDKVVDLLVDDTIIDDEKKEIKYPFTYQKICLLPSPVLSSFDSPSIFSTYVRDVYGLTGREIEYVWGKYKSTVRDKFKNGR
jgi:hypothetical protein